MELPLDSENSTARTIDAASLVLCIGVLLAWYRGQIIDFADPPYSVLTLHEDAFHIVPFDTVAEFLASCDINGTKLALVLAIC